MQNWITDFMESYGYLAVFFMIMIENVFPPIPSELILTFGGFMTTYSELTIGGTILVSTLGSVAGALILYGLGYVLRIERMERIVERYGHVLRVKKEDLHKANSWFDRYGYWTVLLCRMVPLIRSLISIPAGMARMNVWLFLLFTTIGSLIWNVLLVSLGAALGGSWEKIVEVMDVYSSFTYAAIALMLVIGAIAFFRKRRKK